MVLSVYFYAVLILTPFIMNDIIYYITYYGIYAIYALVGFLILKFIFTRSVKNYHSRWQTYYDSFTYSPKEFYARLKIQLESHGIRNLSIKEIYLNTGGMMSHSRLYLRLTWRGYQYDICCSKFANAFFVSWWLLYKDSMGKILISRIPAIGSWLARKLYPVTYYRIDSASVFMSYAQASVLKVIDDITNEKGVRGLNEAERKPLLNNIFIR